MFFSEDSIKYKARSFNRRAHGEDTSNFNPFARLSSRSTNDEGLRRTRTGIEEEGLCRSTSDEGLRRTRTGIEGEGSRHHGTHTEAEQSQSPSEELLESDLPDSTDPSHDRTHHEVSSSRISPSAPANPDYDEPQEIVVRRRKWGVAGGRRSPSPKLRRARAFTEHGLVKDVRVRASFWDLIRMRLEHTAQPRETFPEIQSGRTWKQVFAVVAVELTESAHQILLGVLLLFIPAGFILRYLNASPVAVFTVNFIAIFPSAMILGPTVELLMGLIGEVPGILLNMTFGNAAQLISSILLLKTRQIRILQTTLLGGILANLLLMTGTGFLLGGINREEQKFNARVAQTISMLLLLATLSLVIPTASHFLNDTPQAGLAAQSRGTAIIVIISYGLWLLFQITNKRSFDTPELESFDEELYDEPEMASQNIMRKLPTIDKKPVAIGVVASGLVAADASIDASAAARSDLKCETGKKRSSEKLEGQTEDPKMGKETKKETKTTNFYTSVPFGIAIMTIATVLLAFNTDFATNSINGLLTEAGLPDVFVGLVILPLLSCDLLSVKMAMDDQMDASIALTLEKCMQTALLIVLLIVLLAWMMDIPGMTLEFNEFLVVTLFAAIIIVTYVVQEGKSNWYVF